MSVSVSAAAPTPVADERPAWVRDLEERLSRIQRGYAGELGVHVLDLDSGQQVSLRGEETWYLASGVKVPVAIAVIRRIEDGTLALDGRLALEDVDFVDGAGPTKRHRPGARLRIDYLIEQMLVHSDNTATDVLIRAVGLDQVNAIASELLAQPAGWSITTLADVRRQVYSGLHGSAFGLTGNQLLALRAASPGPSRLDRLAELLGIARSDLLLPDIDAAYQAYYARNLNAGRLRDVSAVMVALAEGRALAPEGTGYLLDVLSRVQTGQQRIKAGLPDDVVFAHKTGTQHQRVCDFGLILRKGARTGRQVAISACSRGAVSTARAERALRDVGAAVTASGLLATRPSPADSQDRTP